MAILRAIENGVSLVRVGDNELSVITDPYGRVLASMDFFTAGERVIVAQVPTQGVFTIYSVIGDLVGWLSVAGLVVMIGWVILSRRTASPVATAPMERPMPFNPYLANQGAYLAQLTRRSPGARSAVG